MSAFDFLKDKYNKVKTFVRQNPTPASFVNKNVLKPIVRSNKNTLDNMRVGTQNYFKPKVVNNKLNLRTRDVVRELGTQTRDIAQSIPQSFVRAGMGINKTIGLPTVSQYTPTSKVGKTLLGNKPVKPAGEYGKETLQGFGVGEKSASRFALPVGIALTAADIIPGIGGKSQIAKTLTKIDDVAKVKKMVNVSDDVAKLIAKSKNAGEIDNLIKTAKTAPIAKATDPFSNEAKQLEYAKSVIKNGVFNDFQIKGYMGQDAKYQPHGISSKVWQQVSKEVGFEPKNLQQFNDGTFALKVSPQSTQGTTTPKLKVLSPKGTTTQLLDKNAQKGVEPLVNQGGKGVVKPQLNTSKFNISEAGKKNLDETVATIKPELEQVKGKVLKNEEVVDAAKASKILSREVDPNNTKKATAALTRLRQEVAAGAEGKGLTKDFIENLKVLKSYSADAGRKLQAFNITASPETSIKESVIADLVNLGKNSDELITAAKGVDFDNPKQVTEFYRKFVKPTFGEVIDEYRYINLLSSPQTHIVNAFSNLLQGTVVSPATKLYSGVVDLVGSTLTGKARTAYVSEVPAYTKGFINSIGDAVKQASEVFKGNKFVERPDINRIPTGKLKAGNYVMRALEAGDVLFRTMIKGGELESLMYRNAKSGKKVAQSVLKKQAADKAEYFVFRKALDSANKTGQGSVLSAIDRGTEAIYKLRKVPGVGWIIPFVQTPMNILKQGIEYSPAGLSTLIGNTNKTEQIAKSLVGSTVMAGAGMLAMKGDSTWDAPTGKNEKEEFYASGRKPYSIKIGDNWVSYSRLGSLAYPIAMAAAVKWYFEQDPKASSTDTIDKTTKMLGGITGFFSDQSYLSGIGDLVDMAKGEEYAIKGTLSNFARQLVPLSSLQGWVARQLDPIYRQPKGMVEQIKTGVPFLSKDVPAYTDPLGNDSKRLNNTFNSYSPINVTPANQQFESIYQKRQLEKKSEAESNSLTSGSKQLSNGKIAVVINDKVEKFNNQQEATTAINKDAFDKSGKKSDLIDGTYYYKKKDGDVGTYTEDEYNMKLTTAKLETAYDSKNYKEYLKVAEQKLKLIESQYNNADPLTQIELQNDYNDLLTKVMKYKSYGGFTKGKKAKKISLNLSMPKTVSRADIKLRKPTAPNINIKTISTGGSYGGTETRPKSLRVKRQF